ncbi:leucyl/phenylalanyl-tRNA--protein transferase [Pluralibacter gergoviae]|uniref:leucyl/phenylalanyl-tRNA--protein transferase n=1 Tax=Pluralibacter gergoviae TaxID=61647 RepID=UPI0005EC5575|nr:leucyl/phenylalanyl-tRNA--protein transferase [Pluralibacter gergoviae]EKV0928396.1 leucyl/phenylalanyl-tRNA--protein transferase [Pluralibacter gergoviae]EKV6246381.1 leucyl/phenylalanyl-tRNA--protein transferase [Pluralibacter gergoviae]EKW9964534.1 leucyl/phenylalanyl-tRNA--protein transferase [Pluralibacter gergoviae]ELD4269659.1 leucyl/phenylalanyl-tRNA--protein transferase [Pluralibacter gergoviae]ELD4275863.1 leucyl/phenylalanyl-tRNA--protein transferase [Pluralibacter gergoviae]
MRLVQLSRHSIAFPSPEAALREPNGLLALGGDLSPARLLMAYQQGIFPWFSPGDPILWWSPDPRAVLWPEQFHLSRSMKRFHKASPYRITLNHAFDRVIRSCADERNEGTWITEGIILAYQQLHELGHAHSIEVWRGDELVGGMYGVAQGALFCGESMFSRAENASKTALLVFCQAFIDSGGRLLDCQVLNNHTASLGAVEIPRKIYLEHLSELRAVPLAERFWVPRVLFSPSA